MEEGGGVLRGSHNAYAYASCTMCMHSVHQLRHAHCVWYRSLTDSYLPLTPTYH